MNICFFRSILHDGRLAFFGAIPHFYFLHYFDFYAFCAIKNGPLGPSLAIRRTTLVHKGVKTCTLYHPSLYNPKISKTFHKKRIKHAQLYWTNDCTPPPSKQHFVQYNFLYILSYSYFLILIYLFKLVGLHITHRSWSLGSLPALWGVRWFSKVQ